MHFQAAATEMQQNLLRQVRLADAGLTAEQHGRSRTTRAHWLKAPGQLRPQSRLNHERSITDFEHTGCCKTGIKREWPVSSLGPCSA